MADGWDLARRSVLAGAKVGGAAVGKEFEPAVEKYSIEGPIGRGGMGEILLVTDHDLCRQVAMKVLLPEVAGDADSRLHFVAEAQATSPARASRGSRRSTTSGWPRTGGSTSR